MTSSIGEVGPHIQAVIDQLEAEVPGTIKVSLGVRATGKPPHIIVFPYAGDVDSKRLAMENEHINIRFALHTVGVGPEQAMWAMDKARGALLGQSLPVSGRRTQRITQRFDAVPLSRDLSTQPPEYVLVTEFQIASQRGAE